MIYRDRSDAGKALSRHLTPYSGRTDVVVLALPRGGVPVGFEVAQALGAPLDIFLVRKLGTPGQEELALGALASGGVMVVNPDVVRAFGVSDREIEKIVESERAELARRERAYRGGEPPADVKGKVVIVVDDGLATGSSMRAAIEALRALSPASIVVAVPVGPSSTCRELAAVADEVVCPETPRSFSAVGDWYNDFAQVEDGEVRDLLRRSRRVSAA